MSGTAPQLLRRRHAANLHDVARELQALHREMLVASDEAHGHVRTSVTNLVAACTDPEQADRAEAALLSIGAHHPARAVVILARPDGSRSTEADVSLHAAGDASEATTELVRLEVNGAPALHLTGIVAPLLIPDMPTYLWILGSPPLRQAFSEDTVEVTERIVVDSGAYDDAPATLSLIAEQQRRFGADLGLADLAWERTLSWREMVAQAFDAAASRPMLRAIERLSIRCAGAAPSTEAWLFAGWMASRLSWPERGGPRVDVTATDEAAPGGGGAGALAEVTVESARGGVTAMVVVLRRGDCLHTSATHGDARATQRTVTVRSGDDAGLISRLMTDAADSHIYAAAVSAAVAMLPRAS